MYETLLVLHSWLRWILLVSTTYTILRFALRWKQHKQFSSFDHVCRHVTATFSHVQLTVGLCLYFISPITTYFLANYSKAIHVRSIRFFGMEHSLMMLLGILLISIGAAVAKRKEQDAEKFKTVFIYYSIALIVILISVPWPFSPMAQRVLFRFF